MTTFLTILAVVLADRIIPINIRRFVNKNHFTATMKEQYKAYGIVKFPRTLFAIMTCVSSVTDSFIAIDADMQAYIIAVCATLFGITACYDASKAARPKA